MLRLEHLGLTLLLAFTGCPGNSSESQESTTCKGTSCNDSPCGGGTSTPILDKAGAPTGFETCADGSIHRASVQPADPTIATASCGGTENYQTCTSDSECTDRVNGKCITGVMVDGPETYCGCVYSCASDADCGVDEACIPAAVADNGGGYSSCQPASCHSDVDCASGECGLSAWDNGCGTQLQLSCRSAADTCRTSGDCPTGTAGAVCGVETGDTTFRCQEQNCAIGRPLLVEGEARHAPSVARRDWNQNLRPSILENLDTAIRAELKEHWLAVAALEHASVGSFARFTLQLMAIGAPPELLADTQRAAGDEVRHAQVAYGLASAYGGEAMGPGPLDLRNLPLQYDFMTVMRGLVEEACVGETLGAAEAAEAAANCVDPVVRAILEEIAEDEARHAALAWKSLRWMLQQAPEQREWVRSELLEALKRVKVADAPSHPELGMSGGAARARLHARLRETVLEPLIAAA